MDTNLLSLPQLVTLATFMTLVSFCSLLLCFLFICMNITSDRDTDPLDEFNRDENHVNVDEMDSVVWV